MIALGLGCRKGVSKDAVIAAITNALDVAGLQVSEVTALIIPAFKADEIGILGAAAELGLEVRHVQQGALKQVEAACPTKSQVALRAIGVSSVSEATALVGAGPGASLLLSRQTYGSVTIAIAQSLGESPTQ